MHLKRNNQLRVKVRVKVRVRERIMVRVRIRAKRVLKNTHTLRAPRLEPHAPL